MGLGLALSGGGFRASLFHIGVLARMAELDLLGQVEVLSCVSGGSIVGAMYYLLLKEMLEQTPAPARQNFMNITRELETRFMQGVQGNPRMRLLTNPLRNLQMALTEYSRTKRMADLLYRDCYGDVWRRQTGQSASTIPLNNIKIEPPGYASRTAFNNAHAYKIPMLVINATTLNTGKNFRFTASEVGDPYLGYIRFDEAGELVRLKRIFDRNDLDWARGMDVLDLYELRKLASAATLGPLAIRAMRAERINRRLDFLGLNRDQLRNRLAPYLPDGRDLPSDADLFSFLYQVRVAAQVTDKCAQEMEQLSLEEAVAASAAVPGIFEPIVFRALYDDQAVEVVRLADGGVYDNQGLTALFEEGCTHVVCSDASGQLVFETDSSGKLWGVVARTNDVLMEKIRFDELARLRETHDTTEDLTTLALPAHATCPGHTPPVCQSWDVLRSRYNISQVAFFHLRSRFPAAGIPDVPADVQEAISMVRTDLDSFSDTEAQTLMYDGYYLSSHTLTPEWFSDFVPDGTAPTPPPPGRWTFYPPPLTRPDLLGHLQVAANRLFKVFRLWWTWPGVAAWLTILLLFGIAWYWIPETTLNEILMFPFWLAGHEVVITVGFFVPFTEALAEFSPRLKRILEFSVLPIGNVLDFRFHLPLMVLAAIAAFAAYQWWGVFKRWLQRRSPPLWYGLRFIIAYKRLPLLPIALAWAFIASILAWVHLWVFDQLFLQAGRIRR